MSYSPTLIANAVLYRAQQAGRKLDHMQVQKLVYFVHAWSLAWQGVSVVSERPEAWTYGPVFSSLYHRLKGYGSALIDKLLPEMQPETGQFVPLIPNFGDEYLWNLVNQVFNRYGNFSALQLSALTHEPNGPWEQTRNARQTLMSDDVIKEYFSRQLSHGAAS